MGARLLVTAQAPSGTRALPRGPILVSIAISLVLLACTIFVGTAIHRAADMAVRGQVEALREVSTSSHESRDEGGLRRLVDAQAANGLRYAAIVLDDGTLGPSAGTPLGRGVVLGPPRRVGNRVRFVIPEKGLLLEIEPIAANDIVMAGGIALVVVVVVAALTVALGVLFARSLRTREELARRLESERRLAALGEMSAVLAHELKNPLTSLKGNAQLLAEALPADKKVERVVREAVRIERLTNDLLELVRTGAVARRSANVCEVVSAAIEAQGNPRIDPLAGAPVAACEIDPDRLRVAVENVIRNAIQASDEGRVEVSVEDVPEVVTIVVRDHGPGLGASGGVAIFEPFRTSKAKGTGLGLTIARRILELHGGKIEASDHPDGGAVFRMTIPRR